jgi:hypothetical protein
VIVSLFYKFRIASTFEFQPTHDEIVSDSKIQGKLWGKAFTRDRDPLTQVTVFGVFLLEKSTAVPLPAIFFCSFSAT